MTGPAFEGRSSLLFVGAALAVGLLMTALFWGSRPIPATQTENSAESRSALGYGALVSWLKAEGFEVGVSKSHTTEKNGSDDIVLVLEPSPHGLEERERLGELFSDYWWDSRLIVVLPKWRGTPDRDHPGWIDSIRWVDPERPTDVLTLLFELVESEGQWDDGEWSFAWDNEWEYADSAWDEEVDDPSARDETRLREVDVPLGTDETALDEVDDPTMPTPMDLGVDWPTLQRTTEGPARHRETGLVAAIEPLQSMNAPDDRWLPVIENEDGVLAAFIATDLLVISDPDLLNNAGIGAGENAALVRSLLSMASPEAIWVDESTLGADVTGGVWGELFRFPLILVTLHLIALLVLGAWAATQRFGPARPVEPRFLRGKELFLTHTGELLQLAGHGGDSLVRYLALAELEVARSLGWSDLPLAERKKRLRALGGRDEMGEDFASLTQDVNALTVREITPNGVLRMAQRIDRWRRKVVSGRSLDGTR